jgi:hypothetical protein
MTLRLTYMGPRAPATPVADPDDAVYSLAAAGATAAVELGARYRLPLDGATGLAELRQHVERLITVLRTGEPVPGDDRLRAELPDVPATAMVHSWHFPSYMLELPVIVFAIDGPVTRVYTRTLSEGQGRPLVVAEDRDLADAVEMSTAALLDEAQTFINQVDRDAAVLTHRAPPGPDRCGQ